MQQGSRAGDDVSQAAAGRGATQPGKSPGRRNTPKPYGPMGSKSQGRAGFPGAQARGAELEGRAQARPPRRPLYGARARAARRPAGGRRHGGQEQAGRSAGRAGPRGGARLGGSQQHESDGASHNTTAPTASRRAPPSRPLAGERGAARAGYAGVQPVAHGVGVVGGLAVPLGVRPNDQKSHLGRHGLMGADGDRMGGVGGRDRMGVGGVGDRRRPTQPDVVSRRRRRRRGGAAPGRSTRAKHSRRATRPPPRRRRSRRPAPRPTARCASPTAPSTRAS